MFRRRLHTECQTLTRAGIDVHLFEPDLVALITIGINAPANDQTQRVVRVSFLAAGAKIAANPVLGERLTVASTTPRPRGANVGAST
jgi:hypothetical protein